MTLSNDGHPVYGKEQHRVFAAHLNDPRYPKHLTVPELLAQVDQLRYNDLAGLVPQIGGGGKLKSHFRTYIEQVNCACWSSWKAAWKDFADYMEFDAREKTDGKT